jgi:hypothetical protein
MARVEPDLKPIWQAHDNVADVLVALGEWAQATENKTTAHLVCIATNLLAGAIRDTFERDGRQTAEDFVEQVIALVRDTRDAIMGHFMPGVRIPVCGDNDDLPPPPGPAWEVPE